MESAGIPRDTSALFYRVCDHEVQSVLHPSDSVAEIEEHVHRQLEAPQPTYYNESRRSSLHLQVPEAKINRQGDGEVAQDVVTCTFGHMQPKTFTYDYKTVSSMYGTPFVLQVQEDETLQEIFQRCSVFCHATVDEISKWQLVIYDVDGNVDAIEATTVRYDASNQGQNSQLAQTTHAYSTGDPHSMTLTENEESMSLASGTSIDQDTPTATHAFLSLKLLQHPHVQRRIVELRSLELPQREVLRFAFRHYEPISRNRTPVSYGAYPYSGGIQIQK